MTKYSLRFRAVNKDTFLDIKSGKKTVETRAALREAYYSYPNYKEKIKKFGLIA